MIFDTWGGLLPAEQYREFSLNSIKDVISRLRERQQKDAIPCIVFGKGNGLHLEAIADSGCDAIGVDWTVDMKRARKRLAQRVALQGNLDPEALFASEPALLRSSQKILRALWRIRENIFKSGPWHPDCQSGPEKVAAI